MSDEEIDVTKDVERLLDEGGYQGRKRSDILPNVTALVRLARANGKVITSAQSGLSHGDASIGVDGDAGANEQRRGDSLQTLDVVGFTGGQIDKAIRAVREGAYGTCSECNGRIPKTRLNGYPQATECVKHADAARRGGGIGE